VELPGPPAIDERYAELRALLPAHGTLGFVTDVPLGTFEDNEGDRRYLLSSYALAPLVLVAPGPDTELAVADVVDPASLGAVARTAIRSFERRAEPEPRPAPAPAGHRILLAVAALLAIAIFVEHAHRYPDGQWDAWMIWTARARRLWRAASLREAFAPELV